MSIKDVDGNPPNVNAFTTKETVRSIPIDAADPYKYLVTRWCQILYPVSFGRSSSSVSESVGAKYHNKWIVDYKQG